MMRIRPDPDPDPDPQHRTRLVATEVISYIYDSFICLVDKKYECTIFPHTFRPYSFAFLSLYCSEA
jgi:hypothetical protein